MWRVLDDSIEVSTVFQIHWFIPYWQMHGGIEEKHPVVTCPHYTPTQEKEKERCIYTFVYTQKHNTTGCLWYSHCVTKKSWWRKTVSAAPKWPRERILGHKRQLRATKTRWAEFDRLIQILMYFCLHLLFFHNHFFQQVHKIFKWINPQYVLHQAYYTFKFYVINAKATNFSDVPH